MTLILDLGLDVLKIYLLTENEVCTSIHSKVREHEQDKQTDGQMRPSAVGLPSAFAGDNREVL